jgi:hypothetical protein
VRPRERFDEGRPDAGAKRVATRGVDEPIGDEICTAYSVCARISDIEASMRTRFSPATTYLSTATLPYGNRRRTYASCAPVSFATGTCSPFSAA